MGKFADVFGNVVGKLQTLSKVQKITTVAVTATSLVVVGGGAALVSTAGGSGSVFGTESTQSEWGRGETETELVTEVIHEIHVKLETSSIDKDLKIKVVDEAGELVSGYEFEFEVAQVRDLEEKEESNKTLSVEELKMEDYDSEKYIDDDKDGMVHILNIEGGDYLVSLAEMEEIIIDQKLILAEVKGKLEYKKVEIKNEVKNESQINAAIEDTANNNVVVESVLADTLPLIPTNVISSEVTRDMVDMSNFPKAAVGETYDATFSGKVFKYCTEHVEVESKVDIVDATCTTTGSYTSVMNCSICGKEMSRTPNQEIPLKNHTPGASVEENRVEPQIGVDGSYEKVISCSVCSTEISRETVIIPALADPNAGTDSGNGNEQGNGTGSGDGSDQGDAAGQGDGTNPGSTEPASEPDSQTLLDETDVTTKRYMGNAIVATAEVESLANTSAETGTKYAVDASAKIAAPKMSKVYLHSKEDQTVTWSLTISDENGVIDINNIQFGVDHTAVAEVKQDPTDKTKVTITAKKAGTANVIINIPTFTVDASGNKTTT